MNTANIVQLHYVVAQPSGHCRGHAKCLVNPAEVVVHEVDQDGMLVVLNLFAECVGKPCEATHAHPHREVLPFNVAGRNVLPIRITDHCMAIGADDAASQTETPPA